MRNRRGDDADDANINVRQHISPGQRKQQLTNNRWGKGDDSNKWWMTMTTTTTTRMMEEKELLPLPVTAIAAAVAADNDNEWRGRQC